MTLVAVHLIAQTATAIISLDAPSQARQNTAVRRKVAGLRDFPPRLRASASNSSLTPLATAHPAAPPAAPPRSPTSPAQPPESSAPTGTPPSPAPPRAHTRSPEPAPSPSPATAR